MINVVDRLTDYSTTVSLIMCSLSMTASRKTCINHNIPGLIPARNLCVTPSLSECFLSVYTVILPNRRKICTYKSVFHTVLISHLLHTNSLFEINRYCSFFYKYSWHGGMIITSTMTWRQYIILKKNPISIILKTHKCTKLNYKLLKTASYP